MTQSAQMTWLPHIITNESVPSIQLSQITLKDPISAYGLTLSNDTIHSSDPIKSNDPIGPNDLTASNNYKWIRSIYPVISNYRTTSNDPINPNNLSALNKPICSNRSDSIISTDPITSDDPTSSSDLIASNEHTNLFHWPNYLKWPNWPTWPECIKCHNPLHLISYLENQSPRPLINQPTQKTQLPQLIHANLFYCLNYLKLSNNLKCWPSQLCDLTALRWFPSISLHILTAQEDMIVSVCAYRT